MDRPIPSHQILIADLLNAFPWLASLLLELRVDCLGCSMNKFCTLEEMSTRYDLDLERLRGKIRERLNKTTN